MACLPQLGSVPAAYAVVAGGCDWPRPPEVSYPILTSLRIRVRPLYVDPYVACVALDGNPA